MKNWALLAVALLALAATGCVSNAKPATSLPAVPTGAGTAAQLADAAAAEPLSTPQTHVVLTPEQTFDPEALAVEERPPQPAPAQQPPARAAVPRGRAATASTPPKPEAPPAATVEAAPPSRPPMQESLPDAKISQLRDTANAARKRVHDWLALPATQRLTGQAKTRRDDIEKLVKRSEEAEGHGDFNGAVQYAARAELLMQEFQSGR